MFPQLLETARLACAPERLCLSAASGDTVTALELVKQLKVRIDQRFLDHDLLNEVSKRISSSQVDTPTQLSWLTRWVQVRKEELEWADREGRRPLHHACHRDNAVLVDDLLERVIRWVVCKIRAVLKIRVREFDRPHAAGQVRERPGGECTSTRVAAGHVRRGTGVW